MGNLISSHLVRLAVAVPVYNEEPVLDIYEVVAPWPVAEALPLALVALFLEVESPRVDVRDVPRSLLFLVDSDNKEFARPFIFECVPLPPLDLDEFH